MESNVTEAVENTMAQNFENTVTENMENITLPGMENPVTQSLENPVAQSMENPVAQGMVNPVTQSLENTLAENAGKTELLNAENTVVQNMETQNAGTADNTVMQNVDHNVTQGGDTAPDLTGRKPTVHVTIISDVVCPWCWIAKRSLEKAMDLLQEKLNFDVQFSPFLLRPKCPPEGIPNPDFNNGGHPKNVILSDVCKDLDIDLNFSCPIVPNSVPALTLRQYARESKYPNVVQSQVADRLHEAYFTHGKTLAREHLLQLAKELMLDMKEVEAYLDDPDNQRRVIDQAEAWRKRGVQAVPFFYLNGKAACSGAQDTKDFIKTILKVAEKFPEEQMGDAVKA